jgi:hypothetical protein
MELTAGLRPPAAEKGDGSKDKPYATIAEALASPKGGPIYLCAETFTESVQIKSGTTIYGALNCAGDWTYTPGTKSEISPGAAMVPLIVDPQMALVMQDVRLRAKDAAELGGSSLADPDDNSISGAGGIGQEALGGVANPGFPLGTPNGGDGELMMECTVGKPGDPGVSGGPGVGAQGAGTISSQANPIRSISKRNET